MSRGQSDRRYRKTSSRLEATKRKVVGWNAFVDKIIGGLSPVEALIWAVLFRHAVDGVVTRANSLLKKDVNVSEKTVRRAITVLKKAGLLQVVRQGGLHVGPSTYRLMARDMRRAKQESPEATATGPAHVAEQVPEPSVIEAA